MSLFIIIHLVSRLAFWTKNLPLTRLDDDYTYSFFYYQDSQLYLRYCIYVRKWAFGMECACFQPCHDFPFVCPVAAAEEQLQARATSIDSSFGLLCRGVFDFAVQAHMTSVVVHVSPLLLSYGLRWYAAPVSDISMGATHFRICDGDAESCLNVSFSTLLFGTMPQFYLWWLILYYMWIFVALGSYIERHAYQTLWDRILVGFSMRGLVCQKLSKYIQTIPKRSRASQILKDVTHVLS